MDREFLPKRCQEDEIGDSSMRSRGLSEKTLLFNINTIGGGGAERVITQVANYMSSVGCNVIIVTSFAKKEEYPLAPEIKRVNLDKNRVNKSRLIRNFFRISGLRRICKQYKADAVISFMAESNFRNVCATVGLSTKSIISVRNDPAHEYPDKIYRFIAKFILPCADGCIFQTEDARKWFPKRLQKKSSIIFNAVDPAFFSVRRAPGNAVVTLGRLCEQKNHAMLIKAFAEAAPHDPDIQLQIYGKGILDEPLRKLIFDLGLADRVRLMGTTTRSAEVLSKARVFVLSSDYEGMPNALMEAMAAGVPSISTDCPCGGPKMLIKSGINGILVPVGDEKAMAEAISALLKNEAAAEEYGKAAKEMAAEFHPDLIFKQWREYIEGVLRSVPDTPK